MGAVSSCLDSMLFTGVAWSVPSIASLRHTVVLMERCVVAETSSWVIVLSSSPHDSVVISSETEVAGVDCVDLEETWDRLEYNTEQEVASESSVIS